MRCLGKDVSSMKQSIKTSLLKKVHSSTERLQYAIDLHSYLLTCHSDPPDTSSKPLSKLLSHAVSYDLSDQLNDSNPQTQDTPSGTLPLPLVTAESYHEMMRKQMRRLHSWPSREVDAFEEEGGLCMDTLPRMRALESTAALSLATFTSLLIEFVARLDHLVEAVDQLAVMAKFNHESL